jgi:hypothetical protein
VQSPALRAVLGLALLVSLAIPASAQNVSAGVGGIWINDTSAFHVTFGAGVPLTASDTTLRVEIIGEVSLQFFDETTTAVGGGFRVLGKRSAKVRPFGHMLAGGFFCCDENGFGLELGGGLDIPLKAVVARLQADVPIAFNNDETRTGYRFTVGLLFDFQR